MNEKKETLEVASKKPNLALMTQEIESAADVMRRFIDRNEIAMQYWQSRWDNQSTDGRRRSCNGEAPWPFDGASDARVRTVKQVVRDHITLFKAAFNRANVQAQSIRPFAQGQGKRSNQHTSLLRWQMNVLLKAEFQRELPLLASLKYGFGAGVVEVTWEQVRRLESHDLTIPMVADIISYQTGLDEQASAMMFFELQSAFADEDKEDDLVAMIEGLMLDDSGKPAWGKKKIRKVVSDLRTMGVSEVQIPYLYKSKPKIQALRIGEDIIFKDQMGNIQDEPWVARIERGVTETTLRDRIETEDYDKDFVNALLETGGNTQYDPTGALWQSSLGESWTGNGEPNWTNRGHDLVHFYYKTIHEGTPCVYRTVFSPSLVTAGKKLNTDEKWAWHGKFDYAHGEYPFVSVRMEKEMRPITSSQGIPEIAYTWEMEEKEQADGLADRTQLVNYRPMIVPHKKVMSIKGQMRPGAVMGVERPNDIKWMDLPAYDSTPVQVMEQVAKRVQEFFGIFGVDLDPQKKMLRQQEVGDDGLGELCLMLTQIYQLDMQFMKKHEVEAITGPLDEPWPVPREQIQNMPHISATFDASLLDVDQMTARVQLLSALMPLNQSGTANTSAVFRAGAEIVFGPDGADLVVENDQVATERERREEKSACAEIMVGSEPDKPMFANNELRLQVINEFMRQPSIYQQLMQRKDLMDLMQNRVEFFQNQIQQYSANPQIGRTLATKTVDSSQPSAVTQPALAA